MTWRVSAAKAKYLVGTLAIGLSRWRMAHLWPRADAAPPILVVSPGGVATTMFLKHVRKFAAANEPFDLDGWKHIPVPPRRSFKIIYIYGDVDMICANAVRREWVPRQGAKLGQPLCAVTTGRTRQRLFRRAVERQMQSFLGHPGVLSVRYDDLWQAIGGIAVYLSIEDPEFVAGLPPRRERLTKLPAVDNASRTES